ncbi:MAG: hypothetical protein ABI847_15620 [Anaerolineales bacterium]
MIEHIRMYVGTKGSGQRPVCDAPCPKELWLLTDRLEDRTVQVGREINVAGCPIRERHADHKAIYRLNTLDAYEHGISYAVWDGCGTN